MIVLPDTSLVWNFHALGRLDLVKNIRDTPTSAPKEAGWAEAIHEEAGRRIPEAVPELIEIFGAHTAPNQSQRNTTATIRSQIFRKDGDDARMHTGESETIAIWSDEAPISTPIIFLTEDTDVALFCWRSHVPGSRASELAGGRKFTPVTTMDVLESATTSQLITVDDRSTMIRRLRDEGQPCIGYARSLRADLNAGKFPDALTW